MAVEARRSAFAACAALSSLAGFAGARSNPLISVREARLIGHDTTSGDLCGYALDVAGDLAVVGAPYADLPGAVDAGAVYVFARTPSGWVERAKLAASDGAAADRFGWSVAILGGAICVGAPMNDNNGVSQAGAVYVFELQGSTWIESAKLVGAQADTSEAVGWRLDAEGDTIAAGAVDDHHSGGATTGGAVYVFVRSGGAWAQQARLAGSDSVAFDYFGQSLALSGETLVVGANGDNHPGFPGISNGGSVYVFERANGVWTETEKIVPPDVDTGDLFGWSVAFDGSTLAVGAMSDDEPIGPDSGTVRVYDRTASGFVLAQTLGTPAQQASRYFGFSVAIEGDVLIGGTFFGDGSGVLQSGSAHVFERSAGVWGDVFELRTTATEAQAGFGTSIAFDGTRAVVGAVYDDTLAWGSDSGSAYAYRVERTVESYCTAKPNSLGCVPELGWSGLPSATSPQPFVVSATSVLNHKSGLFFYGVVPSAAPFHGGFLCVAAPLVRTAIQSSGGSASGDDCTGSFALDFNAYAQGGVNPDFTSGTDIFVQCWSRDPWSADPTSLTDALRFWLGP